MSRSNASHPYQRSIPGKQDTGQRFKVTYRDGTGRLCPYGFADDRDVAESFVDRIKQNPLWSAPRIVDREARR